MQPQITLIVQIRLSEPWGGDEEMEERDRIAETIGAALNANGCGYFDGTDVGGGATNLFFCQIPEDRWDDALAIAVKEIEQWGLTPKT